uniref:RING-type domain-containing protein n=1 Tax=Chromera velia CCMP2878 TaxID=1169474 RepID=A0A0G4H8Z1_9ALVE|eukprot:Cvel_25297.t1-p1 / transcript=Cvel_25297.t1 / gene=Cvel_25297 / organism=Chromera_velia_CCMP2878 / gene_product=E3 ubiquitin-protein ligase znrf1, putative / transcript_product=E3 ubiquitin-protein ligase znrf1, putative / location=Cvel_scaffold2844:19352-20524(-) / protein_length=391 / sequence_SO=supercontig / SO=protein_coding / is_pseudo=false
MSAASSSGGGAAAAAAAASGSEDVDFDFEMPSHGGAGGERGVSEFSVSNLGRGVSRGGAGREISLTGRHEDPGAVRLFLRVREGQRIDMDACVCPLCSHCFRDLNQEASASAGSGGEGSEDEEGELSGDDFLDALDRAEDLGEDGGRREKKLNSRAGNKRDAKEAKTGKRRIRRRPQIEKKLLERAERIREMIDAKNEGERRLKRIADHVGTPAFLVWQEWKRTQMEDRVQQSEIYPHLPPAPPRPPAAAVTTRDETTMERAARNMGLDLETYRFLVSLQDRDITPEDYDRLLTAHEASNKKETATQSSLQKLEEWTLPADSNKETETKEDSGAGVSDGLLIGTACLICLADFSVGDTVRKLPCGCVYHKNCIDTWLIERDKHCPKDRSEI